jgi:dipeptidyl aminopeptidase/acylaminoacyl peptidase
MKVSATGGPVISVAGVEAQLGASWGENDQIVYAAAIGTKGLWRVPAGGGVPQPFTTVLDSALEIAHTFPQVLPDGAVLFTVMGQGWDDSRIAIQDDGDNTHQTVIEHARFGRYVSTGHILFVQDEGAVLAAPFDLRQRRVTGSPFPVLANVPVSSSGAAFFAVADNGSFAFVHGTSTTSDLLMWVDRSGTAIGQVGSPVHGNFIRLSPDGERIAMAIRPPGNVDIWLLDAATGNRDRFTLEPEEDETPVWSSDGKRVAYSATWTGQARRVFVKPVDRSSERRLLYTGQYHIHLSDWSPDDKWLAYDEVHPQNGTDIWLLQADSSAEPQPVATTNASELRAVFSPDGRWLAYQSDETGRPEVYVVPLTSLTSVRQVSTDGGTFPNWAPGGDELFYLNGDTLMVKAVSTEGDDLHLGAARPVFHYPRLFEFDVAPDGQRFVIRTTNTEAMVREIRVVLNWFEELKEMVGRE